MKVNVEKIINTIMKNRIKSENGKKYSSQIDKKLFNKNELEVLFATELEISMNFDGKLLINDFDKSDIFLEEKLRNSALKLYGVTTVTAFFSLGMLAAKVGLLGPQNQILANNLPEEVMVYGSAVAGGCMAFSVDRLITKDNSFFKPKEKLVVKELNRKFNVAEKKLKLN